MVHVSKSPHPEGAGTPLLNSVEAHRARVGMGDPGAALRVMGWVVTRATSCVHRARRARPLVPAQVSPPH